jgi:hypothetical protein
MAVIMTDTCLKRLIIDTRFMAYRFRDKFIYITVSKLSGTTI